MATAGASALAGSCGLQILVLPLLVLAIAQVLWATIAGVWHHRREFHLGWRAWWAIGPAQEHSGIHTAPLGLAVIAGGLTALAADGDGSWLWVFAYACLGLTWLLTLVCVGRFVWSLSSHGFVLQMLDGTWFLVPAALLGAGMATDAIPVVLRGGAAAPIVAGLALAGTLLGWLGYWAVACAALARILRFGLGGVPQAPWWIGMGCAGLAAAALGRTLKSRDPALWLQPFLRNAMAVNDVVAIALCVPVLVLSAAFLLRRCRFHAPASWPPTFSTAVFALGCFESGDVLHSPTLQMIGLGAGYATLLFWAVTILWNAGRTCSRALHR